MHRRDAAVELAERTEQLADVESFGRYTGANVCRMYWK
jgi:hypothetical protein